jgi:quercetin dioxygenase-like cupin family protein
MERRSLIAAIALGLFLAPAALAQPSAIISKPVAERKVSELPSGPLFWRVTNFATTAEAQAASGSYGLVVESFGKVWLFTLGPRGQTTSAGTLVAEIGPLPGVQAPEYLLRVNEGRGVPGAVTTIHTHPGSEAYYVLAGEGSQKTPHGVSRVGAGESLAGHGPDTVMQFINTGTADVNYFALFVVDATKPFTSPAKFDE